MGLVKLLSMVFAIGVLVPVASAEVDKQELDGIQLSSISKGDNTTKPKLLLLSGPTDNWHSDLAWWVLGQNYLAQNYSTIAIDRAGQGFSGVIANPSYQDFAERLMIYIKRQKQPIIVLAFASSNLSVRIALQDPKVVAKVKAIILIDPDVLTGHAIDHYTGESENYRKNWQQLEDFIRAGKYQARVKQKVLAEKEHLEKIIPEELVPFMDWQLYQQYEKVRLTDVYQLRKFKEITAYKKDLEAARKAEIPKEIPVVILDSDFETAYLKTIEDPKVKDGIIKWRDQGKRQFFEQAKKHSCGAYWPVNSQEHLLTYTRPDLIQLAVERVIACNKS